ncbi:MAG TPA: glycosyltransferase family 4 protein [Pyrinomonadaceae bacterium]|jgi:glycosyltransferase involved in cell wall biosynthesis/predicted O-methyltransferase YrrM|nr:glycosyltransferase family 4 protein [Pyrinomonadaceae bacterium]
MKKIAIVVQRCHESVVGGSESLAWHYATLLRDDYEVDVLTTAALETSDWANVLPVGLERRDGVNVRRFRVTVGRSAYWGQLHDRLARGFDPFTRGRHHHPKKELLLKWTLPMQEEFIRNQGPYSAPLMNFIEQHWQDYGSIIFVTYLYPTTYFGLQQLPPGNALFAPTLHDEQPAHLSAYKHAAHRARGIVWLTEAERHVGTRLWGELPGRVVGMAIDSELREPEPSPIPYLLYCGRVDPNKGCPQLFEFYFKYKRATRSKVRLVVTGTEDICIPKHADIEFRGFVPPEEKFRLMAGAAVYMVPSGNESFSIVTLEAMAQRTPVLASSRSEALVAHINESSAGLLYSDYESFASNLTSLLKRNGTRNQMGDAGREYVLRKYRVDFVRQALIDALEANQIRGGQRMNEQRFSERFAATLRDCTWQPHTLYSSFTQYDREHYLAERAQFIHKYRCFYAVSRIISPRSIIELGTGGGAGADAYLSATPTARYLGIDVFATAKRHDDRSIWDPYETAQALFRDRGFRNWQLLKADLRQMNKLPAKAELVVVDAAHDFDNEYADLQLALTANPKFIFVDDAKEEGRPAIEKFLQDDLKARVEFTFPIEYVGGGLVIKLSPALKLS